MSNIYSSYKSTKRRHVMQSVFMSLKPFAKLYTSLLFIYFVNKNHTVKYTVFTAQSIQRNTFQMLWQQLVYVHVRC